MIANCSPCAMRSSMIFLNDRMKLTSILSGTKSDPPSEIMIRVDAILFESEEGKNILMNNVNRSVTVNVNYGISRVIFAKILDRGDDIFVIPRVSLFDLFFGHIIFPCTQF